MGCKSEGIGKVNIEAQPCSGFIGGYFVMACYVGETQGAHLVKDMIIFDAR